MDDLVNNFFLLRKLAERLNQELAETFLADSWQIGKQHIVFHFKNKNRELFLNLFFLPDKVLISLPPSFTPPVKNAQPIFREVQGKKVKQVQAYENDRSFHIRLQGNLMLIFKLYGRHANIILLQQGEAKELLRPKLQKDRTLNPEEMHYPVVLEQEQLQQLMEQPLNAESLVKLNPAYTPDFAAAIDENFTELPPARQWEKIMELENYLRDPQFYLLKGEPKRDDDPGLRLSLFALDIPLWEKTDVVEALNSYTTEYRHQYRLLTARGALLKKQYEKKRRLEKQLKSGTKDLQRLDKRRSYHQLADLIMANLHQIKGGADKAEVFDFYEGKDLVIPLKREMSPQKNAEKMYQKAKRQHIEVEKLKENISRLESELADVNSEIKNIESTTDYRQLKKLGKQEEKKAKSETPALPYKEFNFLNYKILVGKSGKNNDELTFKVASKNDLWLHAKDFAGSHVVVKTKNETVPQPVVEAAAQLAAWHSKGRNHGLCPVSYVQRKHVRKPKGMAPGKVIVDRESVILVVPSSEPGKGNS
ncbi:MAG: NFACT RNA binding domain-containing protein [Bacteroidia bacterium]